MQPRRSLQPGTCTDIADTGTPMSSTHLDVAAPSEYYLQQGESKSYTVP